MKDTDPSMPHVNETQGAVLPSQSFEVDPNQPLGSEEIPRFLHKLPSKDSLSLASILSQQSEKVETIVKINPSVIFVTPSRHEQTNFPRFAQIFNTLDANLPNDAALILYDNIRQGETFFALETNSLNIPNLHLLRVFMPDENLCIGRVRFEASTLALMLINLMPPDPNRLLVFIDADVQGIRQPENLTNILHSFRNFPSLDMVVDWWTHPKEALNSFPLLKIIHRFIRSYQFFREDNHLDSDLISSPGGPKIPVSYAFSTIMRASSFAAIGGFNPNLTANEDSALAIKLAELRKSNLVQHMRYSRQLKQTTGIDHNLEIEIDPRRLLFLMARGKTYAEIHTGNPQEIFHSWVLVEKKPRNWRELEKHLSPDEWQILKAPTVAEVQRQLNDLIVNFFFLPQQLSPERIQIGQKIVDHALQESLSDTGFSGKTADNLKISVND